VTVAELQGRRCPRGMTGAPGATGSARTRNPNANALNGYAANELNRTAGLDVTADLDNWDGSDLVDSVNITAPRAGTLVLQYVFNAGTDFGETGSGTGYLNFTPKLDGSVIG